MRILATVASALVTGALVADNIPALREVTLRPRLGRTNVTMRISGATIRPSDFAVRRSLAGKWKFKGLDQQREPFGAALTGVERDLLGPRTDDKDWSTIDVPMNWWAYPKFSYDTMMNG